MLQNRSFLFWLVTRQTPPPPPPQQPPQRPLPPSQPRVCLAAAPPPVSLRLHPPRRARLSLASLRPAPATVLQRRRPSSSARVRRARPRPRRPPPSTPPPARLQLSPSSSVFLPAAPLLPPRLHPLASEQPLPLRPHPQVCARWCFRSHRGVRSEVFRPCVSPFQLHLRLRRHLRSVQRHLVDSGPVRLRPLAHPLDLLSQHRLPKAPPRLEPVPIPLLSSDSRPTPPLRSGPALIPRQVGGATGKPIFIRSPVAHHRCLSG